MLKLKALFKEKIKLNTTALSMAAQESIIK